MTEFYKNNDDLLRDKLSTHEFTQVPAAWDSMSSLLDAQPIVSKRAIGWWWSVPVVAATALTAVIGWGIYSSPEQIQTNSELKNQAYALAQKVDQNKNETNFNVRQLPASQQQKQATPLVNVANVTNKTATKQTLSQKSTLANQTTRKSNKSKRSNKATIANTTVAQNNIANIEDAQNAVDQINVALQNAIQENTTSTDKPSSKYKVYTRRTEIIRQYSVTPLRALQSKRETIKNTLTKQETTIGDFGIGDELNNKNTRMKVGVFGGASAKIYGATQEFSVMPFAGANLTYKVAPRHAIQVGLQYKGMGRLPNANGDQNTERTFIDNNKTSNAHSLKRIDLLEIPLVYQFFPHRKYNIQAGVKGAWLFNKEVSNPDFNNVSNEEMGLAKFDLGLLVGMEFILSKHWSLGVQYSMGFINLVQQAQVQHVEAMDMDINSGLNVQDKVQSLSNPGEIIVPVVNDAELQEMIRLPNSLYNNDVQIHLKYTF